MRRASVVAASVVVLSLGSAATAAPGGHGGGGGGGTATKVITHAVAASDFAGENSTRQVAVLVTRSGNIKCVSSVDWATADGTAFDGQDYLGHSGTVDFAKNQTQGFVLVDLLNDGNPESSEAFTLTLSHAATTCKAATVAIGNATETFTISDTDVVFTVPDGAQIGLTELRVGGCHLNQALLNISNGTVAGVGINDGLCDTVFPSNTAWLNTTGDPVTVRIALRDFNCNRTYFSDTTAHDDGLDVGIPINHAMVADDGSGGWFVDLADGADCVDQFRVPRTSNGDFSAHVTVGPPV
jgi:hypothetical protein